jgi:hypothetical protein
VSCVGLAYLLLKSLTLNRNYEKFFNASVEDLSMVIQGIDAILIKKPLFTEDPDIRILLRGVRLASEILNNYGKQKANIVGTNEDNP